MFLPKVATVVTVIASTVVAQSPDLVSLLKATPDLSTLSSLIGQYPDIVDAIGKAPTPLTVLAPSNEAFVKFLSRPENAAAAKDKDTLKALLTYHVLVKELPASAFTSTPTFVSTGLRNKTYEQVTDGQVVEGVLDGTDVKIISGLRAESTVVKAVGSPKPFTNGLMADFSRILNSPKALCTLLIRSSPFLRESPSLQKPWDSAHWLGHSVLPTWWMSLILRRI